MDKLRFPETPDFPFRVVVPAKFDTFVMHRWAKAQCSGEFAGFIDMEVIPEPHVCFSFEKEVDAAMFRLKFA